VQIEAVLVALSGFAGNVSGASRIDAIARQAHRNLDPRDGHNAAARLSA
jgi:hypothetical protein